MVGGAGGKSGIITVCKAGWVGPVQEAGYAFYVGWIKYADVTLVLMLKNAILLLSCP